MEISNMTKLQVNSYTSEHFIKTKGTSGYQYTKAIIEYLVESYKKTGSMPSFQLTSLKEMLDLDCSYITFQKNLFYVMDKETDGELKSLPAFFIDIAEKVIEKNRQDVISEMGV